MGKQPITHLSTIAGPGPVPPVLNRFLYANFKRMFATVAFRTKPYTSTAVSRTVIVTANFSSNKEQADTAVSKTFKTKAFFRITPRSGVQI